MAKSLHKIKLRDQMNNFAKIIRRHFPSCGANCLFLNIIVDDQTVHFFMAVQVKTKLS